MLKNYRLYLGALELTQTQGENAGMAFVFLFGPPT